MVINLKKKEKIAISLQNLIVALGWDPAEGNGTFDLDATACMLDEKNKNGRGRVFLYSIPIIFS